MAHLTLPGTRLFYAQDGNGDPPLLAAMPQPGTPLWKERLAKRGATQRPPESNMRLPLPEHHRVHPQLNMQAARWAS